jgi:phosphoribosylglycinamide formyltransferase-1
MRALALDGLEPSSPYEVALVVAPRDDAPGLAVARAMGLYTAAIDDQDPRFADRLVDEMDRAGCAWLCLAGYLRLLPPSVLAARPGRVLNIHPALLPRFGGKGMYGERVHAAVLAAGETESGCTVHLVTDRYDDGPILLQRKCPVKPEDTPETLAARVLELEHRAYSEALVYAIERARTS